MADLSLNWNHNPKRRDWEEKLTAEMALLVMTCVLRERQGETQYRAEDLKLLTREIIQLEDFYGQAWADGYNAREEE